MEVLQIPQLNFLENSKKRFYPSWIRLTGRTILMLPKKKFEKLLKDPSARSKLESLHAARSFKFGSALSEPCYTNYARLNSTVPIVMSKLNMSNFFTGRWPEVDFCELRILVQKNEHRLPLAALRLISWLRKSVDWERSGHVSVRIDSIG